MGPAPPTSPLRLSAHLGERGSPGAGGLSAPLLAAGQGLFPAHVVKRVRTSCAHPHSHSRAWFSWHGGLGHPASPPLACPTRGRVVLVDVPGRRPFHLFYSLEGVHAPGA